MIYLGGIAVFFTAFNIVGMDKPDKIITYHDIDAKHMQEAEIYFREIDKGNDKWVKKRLKTTLKLYRKSLLKDAEEALKTFREFNFISRESWTSVETRVKKIHALNKTTDNKIYDSELIIDESFPYGLKKALMNEMEKNCINHEEINMISDSSINGCGTLRAYPYYSANNICFSRGYIVINPFHVTNLTLVQTRGLAIHLVASLTYKELIFTDILPFFYHIHKNSRTKICDFFIRKIILLNAALKSHSAASDLKAYLPMSKHFNIDTYEFLSNIEWRLRVLFKIDTPKSMISPRISFSHETLSEKDEDSMYGKNSTPD